MFSSGPLNQAVWDEITLRGPLAPAPPKLWLAGDLGLLDPDGPTKGDTCTFQPVALKLSAGDGM